MPYPYPVISALEKRMLRPRQRPGPYYYAADSRIFGVFRDSSTREIIVQYSDDAGATWAEADAGNRPLQTSSSDSHEGGLQHASCVRRIGDSLRILYAPNGGVALAVVDFDMTAGTAGEYSAPITGGPNVAHGWDLVELDNGDTEIFYNIIVSTQYYEIWRVVLSGSTWGTPQQVTDATAEDEIQCPPFGGSLVSSVVASVTKYSSGDRMLFYFVNNNNHSMSSSPFVRIRKISGTTTATVGAPSLGRPPLADSMGVDSEGYANGAAEVISCGGVELAVMPVMLGTQLSTLTNYNGGGTYIENGIVSVYESDPDGLRLEIPAGLVLSQSDGGPSWHQVPCLLWDAASHTLRYYFERCYETDHPTRAGDTDLICAASKLGAWDAEEVVFAANGVPSFPFTGYWMNTFGLLSAGFVASGNIGLFMQASQGTITNDDYEYPHYFEYTPSAVSVASPCSGAAAVSMGGAI